MIHSSVPDFAIIVPMANEERDFFAFVDKLNSVLTELKNGTVYLIIDNVSKDKTLQLAEEYSSINERFNVVWSPKNKNVVDAYMNGYKEAYFNKHDYIIEMDAGLSHNPKEIPNFLMAFSKGYSCVFGSRFIKGGGIVDSNWKRTFLSKYGTHLSNILLGSKMTDMTSGYQGFDAQTVKKFLDHGMRSKAHFYQTELRYLLRKSNFIEIPIEYRAPSPSVSVKSITNSCTTLMYYFSRRVVFKKSLIE